MFQCFERSLFVFSQDGSSSLHEAAWWGHDTVVKKLFHAGADVKMGDQVREHYV